MYKKKVLKGDLFFNTSSETPEEVAMSSTIDENIDELYLNSFCFGFRLNDENINNKFLAYYFRTKYGRELIKSLAQGSTRYNLPKEKFLNYEFIVPSDVKEQENLVNIIINADNEIQSLKEKYNKYCQIRNGLAENLLTGKVRLKDE